MAEQNTDVAQVENRRVARLLGAAKRHGWTIQHKVLRFTYGRDRECWTLRPDPDPENVSLTVYPGRNHSAVVYGELPGNRDWSPVTQRHAFQIILDHRFAPDKEADHG